MKGMHMRFSGRLASTKRWSPRLGHRVTAAALTTAGVLVLTTGLGMASAGAAVSKTTPLTAMSPHKLGTCVNGAIGPSNPPVQYRGGCAGSGPTSYRTLAWCNNNEAAIGIENTDGYSHQSYAKCDLGTSTALLATSGNTGTSPDWGWGYIFCNENKGNTTESGGYLPKSGSGSDMSQILVDVGGGNNDIPQGIVDLCNWNYTNEAMFNPTLTLSPPSASH